MFYVWAAQQFCMRYCCATACCGEDRRAASAASDVCFEGFTKQWTRVLQVQSPPAQGLARHAKLTGQAARMNRACCSLCAIRLLLLLPPPPLLLLLLLLQDWRAARHCRQLPAAAQDGLSGAGARCGQMLLCELFL
jgi:hypothetical protein